MTPRRLAPHPVRAFGVSVLAFAIVLAGSLAMFAGCGLSTGGLPPDDGGMACTSMSFCDDQDPCTTDACGSDGRCTFTPVPDGAAPASAEVPGDCHAIQCSGGQATTVVDDTDVPENPNPCVAESCVMGTPTQDVHANDMQACTLMGANGSCHSGACSVACTTAGQCPTTSTCATASCEVASGTCVYTNVADGTPTPMVAPVAGDCHVSICIGGVAVDQVDPSDVPAIPPAEAGCADAVCSATGTPSNPIHPLDSGCSAFMGGPGHCDAGGHCVDCVVDADCPGATDDCQHPACTSGTCVPAYTAGGVATSGNPAQIPGDCHQIVCDGAGNHDAVVDDTDVPSSGTVCITDTCSGGAVVKTDNPGVPCSAGTNPEVCNAAGQCGCQSNADCTLPSTCFPGKVCSCTPATCASLGKTCGGPFSDGCYAMLGCDDGAKDGTETDVDCGGTASKCATRCGSGKKCTVGSDCTSGFCADGVCCNTACTGPGFACQACSATAKGQGADGTCGAVKLGDDPHNDCAAQAVATCGTTGACNGGSACSTWAPGSVCQASKCSGNTLTTAELCAGGACTVEPPATVDCTPYKCGGSPAACTTTCALDTDCASAAFYCAANHCVAKQPGGDPCTAPDQCTSGVCGTTGTGNCCSAACTTGAPCGATGCDSSGLCVYPTTSCGAASCSNATFTPAGTCGGGTCHAGTAAPCPGDFACSGAACATTCTAPATGCIAKYACAAGTACLLAPGQPCTANNLCASMVCDVGGTGNCCTAACTVGGTCGAMSCNGSGACVYPTGSTTCTGSSCNGAMLTTDTTCNNGTCSGGASTITCGGDLLCSAGACPGGCGADDAAGDADCVSGFWCDGVSGGACQTPRGLGGACDRDAQCSNPAGCVLATGLCP